MQQSMFFDFNVLQDVIVKRKSPYGGKFSDGKIFEYSNEFKEGYAIKSAYAEFATSTKIMLQKLPKGEKHDPNADNVTSIYDPNIFNLSLTPPILYTAAIKISKEKLKDIKELLPYIIPSEKEYFNKIITNQDNSEVFDRNDADSDGVDYHGGY